MHRIDTSTAQKDKFGAGKNGFTGGNPQTGELPTALDQDFFDSLQEEIARLIESAGLLLSKSNNDQLQEAIARITLSRKSPFADIKSDGPDALAAALANLGLGSAAKKSVGNGTGQIPDMSYFTSNSSLTGWKRTPDNYYTEWGYASNQNNGPVTISFPATLPNAVRAINITPIVTSPVGWDAPTIAAYDRTGMVINRKAGGSSGNIQDTNWDFFWCIQGY